MHFWIVFDLTEMEKLLRCDFFSRIDGISSLLWSIFASFSLAKLSQVSRCRGITLRAVGLYEVFSPPWYYKILLSDGASLLSVSTYHMVGLARPYSNK